MSAATMPVGRTERSPAVSAVFALVLFALVAHIPQTFRPQLTGRAVVVLIGVAVGLPLLARLARRGDRPAQWACAFLAWSALAAIASGTPLALSGTFFTMTGLGCTLAIGAFYGIGRSLPDEAIDAVTAAVLAGAAVNGVVAVLQAFASLESYDLPLYDERATGLMGNPVFVGTLCASAVALVPWLLARRRVLGLGVAFLLAAATQLSGTRNALGVLVVLAVWAVWRTPGRLRLALAAAVITGAAFGSLAHPGGESATNRLQGPTGLTNRVENWREAAVAVVDRPIIGYGPGRFAAAATPHRTPALARIGPDRLYEDAHNIFVEYTVTTGVVGVLLLLAWWALASRGGLGTPRPELLVAAGALLVNHLVEPQHLTLTPVMLLLVGSAAPRDPLARSRTTLAAQAAIGALALVVAVVLVVGDFTYRTADVDFDLAKTQRASTLLWPWARPLSTEARIHLYQARTLKEPAELRLGRRAAARALAREPDDPARWIAVAAIEAQLGDQRAAAQTYAEALRRNPWSALALRGRADALRAMGRVAQAAACADATRLEARSGSALRRSRSVCLFGTTD